MDQRSAAAAARIAEIESLPESVRGDALCDWSVVRVLIGAPNERQARRTIQNSGIDLVQINAKQAFPSYSAIKSLLRPTAHAAA